ncbi:MAG: alpha-amylase family glycosyl hydrolase [Oscillospiraceae bacterium]|nr:alpha-amylase family glycosyl hydrolase [Oscillospiraceae bacterium]
MKWYENAVFYHIYPIGYFGCPRVNDAASEPTHKLLKLIDDIPHIKELGCNAIYFGPVFESVAHGYDTIDYRTIDRRLGTNDDFKKVCAALHENGIKVVLDGVFNHVGRDFWAFKDVREHKFSSAKKDWFHLRDGNSCYNDGFYYEGWEGHYELVKLNLYNPEVKGYLKDTITFWKNEFGIDGLRLDVAYCLDENFLKELHGHCKWLSEDFFLLGETLHGDYNRWANDQMLDSVTNYECYKGLFSSFNDMNMFEIAHSINRQFGSENWCIYRGKHLYTFVDNHDVTRVASILKVKEHLPLIYTLMFMMPGIPSVYYGSEFGIEGDKRGGGDDALRPEFNLEKMKNEGLRDLTELIGKLSDIEKNHPAAAMGDYKQVQLTNRQYAFSRSADGETLVTVINADAAPFTFNLNMGGEAENLLTGEKVGLGGLTLEGYSSMVLKV